MRVSLAPDVFPNPASELHLHTICTASFDGRHRLIVENDQHADYLTWLNTLGSGIRLQWDQALNESYLLEAREPATRRIRVSSAPTSNWDLAIPTLTIRDAANHLSQPFSAVLEDWQSDRAFILAVATADQRRFLEEMEKCQALKFDNGGGITNMAKQLRASANRGPQSIMQTWALFDSDALQPGAPSAQSEKTRKICAFARIPHHQLHRRSIESYLPKDALRAWTFNSQQGTRERKKIYDAFLNLTTAQRSHYNMKEGFNGDSKRTDFTAGALYDGLAALDQLALRSGFGSDIASLFSNGYVTEASLRSDGAWTEINGMIGSLVQLVR